MPDFGSTRNPIDLTGQATDEHYEKALVKSLRSKKIDSVMALYCETAVLDPEKTMETIARLNKEYRGKKPIVFSMFGGERINKTIAGLQAKNVPVFDGVYNCSAALGALYKRYRYLNKKQGSMPDLEINEEKIKKIVKKAYENGRSFLLPKEARAIMEEAGIELPKSHVARNIKEAVKYAEDIGYPVVMKIVSEDIIHKSDAGGIALDLENREEVVDAYQAIKSNVRKHYPKAKLEGVEVSEMVTGGVETIVGATRDPSFGPLVMFGLGGIYVETLKDVSFRSVPININDAEEMIGSLKSSPILFGVRGEKRKDIKKIIDTLLKLSKLISCCEEITGIEINPLVVKEEGEGVKALDVRILLKKEVEK